MQQNKDMNYFVTTHDAIYAHFDVNLTLTLEHQYQLIMKNKAWHIILTLEAAIGNIQPEGKHFDSLHTCEPIPHFLYKLK